MAARGLRMATLGSGRGWLGAVVARHAAGRNGRYASNGRFLNGQCTSTAGVRTLQFKLQWLDIYNFMAQMQGTGSESEMANKESRHKFILKVSECGEDRGLTRPVLMCMSTSPSRDNNFK